MYAVLFKAIAFVYFEYKQILSSKSNRSCRQYPVYLIRTGCLGQTREKLYTLFSLEQRGQKTHPVQRHIPV